MYKKIKELQQGDIVIGEEDKAKLEVESVVKGSKRFTTQVNFTNGQYSVVPNDFTVEVISNIMTEPDYGEPEDMPPVGKSSITHNHATIREWANTRGGQPVIIKGTESMLRIDFPGGAGEDSFEPVNWSDWFKVFDELELQFLFQDKKKNGEPSTFFRLIGPNEK